MHQFQPGVEAGQQLFRVFLQQPAEGVGVVAQAGVGGLVHMQDFAAGELENEQAVLAGVGQVEHQLQALAAFPQVLFDVFALADLLVQASVAGLQGAGAAGVLQRQGQGRDQQQAGEQAGAEDELRQGRAELFHQLRGGAQLQGEVAVVEQVQGHALAQVGEALWLRLVVDGLAGLQQQDAEVAVVEVGEEFVHQRLDTEHALEEAVESPLARFVGDIERRIEDEAAPTLEQGEAVGHLRLATGLGLHGEVEVGVVAGQAKAPGGLVARLGQHPAHAQVGAHPLDGLVAGKVLQGEIGFERPLVPGDSPAVVPLQGHAAQALDLIDQVAFQLGGQGPRLVADAVADALLLGALHLSPEQQAGATQSQEQQDER
ncbi:hypothetical protein D9M68_586450 [compost metagenome]